MQFTLPFLRGQLVRDTIANSQLQVLDVLGHGAYAVVYLVKDIKSGTKHALKCLSKRGLSWEQLQLQREEALLHRSLGQHPNIVHLERYFENKDWLFLVLEYCPGRDLFCWISERRDEVDTEGHPRSSIERDRVVKDVFAQVLEAVTYIHQRGIFHRDIKSENFIICNDGVVKLTDFGLATTDKVSTDFDCGSKPYMSPECNAPLNPSYSPRCADIWSLGVLLLTLVYRRTPWAAPAPIECPLFAQFRCNPEKYLGEQFGCESKLGSFLYRKVFTADEASRISSADWLRMWYEGQVMTATAIHVPRSRVSSKPVMRMKNHSHKAVRPLRVAQPIAIQASSAPQKNLELSVWADMMNEDMDFSKPIYFQDSEYESETEEVLHTPIKDTFSFPSKQSLLYARYEDDDEQQFLDGQHGQDDNRNGNSQKRHVQDLLFSFEDLEM